VTFGCNAGTMCSIYSYNKRYTASSKQLHNIYDRVMIITDVKKYQKGSLKGKRQLRQ